MQSKEEIEEALIDFKKEYGSCNHNSSDLIIELETAEIVLQYIEQLETDKQKLIEKLEYAIDFAKTSKDSITKIKIETLENVLKILKGEN